ncbi:MAG: GNAT family N-acetyltransferase, partial [Aggregatilineales bacterium]
FFGMRIARVLADGVTPDFMTELNVWSQSEQIDCLYLLLDAGDSQSIDVAEHNDFHLRDIRMNFQVKRPAEINLLSDDHIRLSYDSDVDPLRQIARTAYSDTRFYHDPCFPRDKCDAMYETWLVKSLTSDFATAVLVAELDGQPVGYMSVSYDAQTQTGQIGLVGVSSEVRGRGIGKRLLQHTLQWFWQQGANEVHVVTQGRNIGAQRLYQACGFRTANVALWYHRWLNPCSPL